MKELSAIHERMIQEAADKHNVSYKRLKYVIKGYLFKMQISLFNREVEQLIDLKCHRLSGKKWKPNINAQSIRKSELSYVNKQPHPLFRKGGG